MQGFIQQFWEKASGQNWEKIIDGKNYRHKNIIMEAKFIPKNQVILDCFMPSTSV